MPDQPVTTTPTKPPVRRVNFRPGLWIVAPLVLLAVLLIVVMVGAAIAPPSSHPTLDAAKGLLSTPRISAPPVTPTDSFSAESASDPKTVTVPAEDASVAILDSSTTDQTTALALLATVPVKGPAPMTGYVRTAMFGAAWLDEDRNGCDTRNDMLSRDLTAIVKSGRCRVLSGRLVSPYTGGVIDFVRGDRTSTAVQIDHVVSLGDAWRTGAQQLTGAQRVALANDPINLFAVDARSNAQKRDGDTATWLPASKPFRCTYVSHQVSVKATYGLWVTRAEHDAMARVLSGCASMPAVTSPFTPTSVPQPVVVVTPDPVDSAPAPVPAAPSCDPNYSGQCVPVTSDVDCAGGSGDGPAYLTGTVTVIGSDHYGLDRNHDGIGCN